MSKELNIKLKQLFLLTKSHGIGISILDCPELKALVLKKKSIGYCHIYIHDGLDVKEKIEALAHELAHCLTDSFYNLNTPFETRLQCEAIANEKAAQILSMIDILMTDRGQAIHEYMLKPPTFASYAMLKEKIGDMSDDDFGEIVDKLKANRHKQKKTV